MSVLPLSITTCPTCLYQLLHTGQEALYTLDKWPVYDRLMHEEKQPYALHSTPVSNLKSAINEHACLWSVGGSRSNQREPTQTRGRHTNSTPRKEPSCCEATTASLFCLLLRLINLYELSPNYNNKGLCSLLNHMYLSLVSWWSDICHHVCHMKAGINILILIWIANNFMSTALLSAPSISGADFW